MVNSESKTRSNKSIYLALVITTIFWAAAFIAGKYSVKEIPPFSVTFLRFFFASIFIFPIMLHNDKGKWKIGRKDLPIIIALGVVGMIGYHVLFFIALKYTSAINSSMIAASNPILVNILSVIFLGYSIGWKRAGAIIMSFMGVLLTITNGNLAAILKSNYNIGDLLMVLAIFSWAVYTIMSKKVMSRYSPTIITTYSFIVAATLLLPFFIHDLFSGYIAHVSLRAWLSVLYMAIFPSVIGYLVWQIGIQRLGTAKTSLFNNLVPVFSIMLSVVFLGEKASAVKLLSAALIILGVYLNTRIHDEVKKPEKV